MNENEILNLQRTDKNCKSTIKTKIEGNQIIITRKLYLEANDSENLKQTLSFFDHFRKTNESDQLLSNQSYATSEGFIYSRQLNFAFSWLYNEGIRYLNVFTKDGNDTVLTEEEVKQIQ